MRNSLLLLLTVLLASCARNELATGPATLDDLTIEVFGKSRELGYTNKEAGFFYTETNAANRTGWEGWHVMSRKLMDDYVITMDSRPLSKSDVQLALVKPDQFTRAYRIGVQETVTLLDSVNAIVIELDKIKADSVSLQPLFGDIGREEDCTVRFTDNGVLMANNGHLRRTPKEDYPAWVGICFTQGPVESARLPHHQGRLFAPAFIKTSVRNGKAVAILVAGDTEDATASLLESVSKSYRRRIADRRKRLEQVLNRALVRTSDPTFDKALSWAILSMDALIMNQGGQKGIFAGLPWFSNYWGRDSFISLPGATLVTGDFNDAREILRSFARWQDTNPRSPTYGRIPNLITPTSTIYNTADGTPWFVLALGDYATMSGDTALVKELYPVVSRSIEGTLRKVDKNGLMTHGDAETWMDAVGPNGPWSPRGNRANDIQALWYKQLLTASWMANMTGRQKDFTEWFSYAEQVRSSFNRLFVDTTRGLIFDHLTADGTPNRQFRPNQLFTLDLVDNAAAQFNAFRSVTKSLVYPYGVASLSQDDPNFHPFHHYPPYYVQDAAYHNGVVWTWLAGPWISAATKFGYTDLAWQVTRNMTHQILERGAVGTLSELLDAVPRTGEKEPRVSGTFSQAWSLAEFIRVAYQDYLGVRIDAAEGKIELQPSLPPGITETSFTIPFGPHRISVSYHSSPSEGIITLASPPSAPMIDVVVSWRLEGSEHNFAYVLNPGTQATIAVDPDQVSVEDPLGPRVNQLNLRRVVEDSAGTSPLRLAVPTIHPGLKALRPPPYRILTHQEISVRNERARVLLDASDPAGDDRGTGSYIYPTTPNLKPGSLDLTHIQISADENNAYVRLTFRNLSNPGWHPEYGFQLTMAAIAIDKDGRAGSGGVRIGHNSGFVLPRTNAYETLILVGGGVQVEDAQGRLLASYAPAPGDETNPIGDTSTNTVSFALPIDLLGTPSLGWRYTVIVGAQDDHGGAGIGDFRAVGKTAQEWSGGGKIHERDPNVYDTFNSTVRLNQ